MLTFVAITAALGVLVYALRRNAFGKIALMLFTLSVCFTALETYYRYFYVRSDGFGTLSRNFAERYYKLDAHGLRASNLPPSETKQNLVVLGDSHVFGAGLKQPSERLSEMLAARCPQMHVINLGLSGWDTRTQIDQLTARLGETRARIPLVVLSYFFNDIEEEVTAADRQRLLPPVAPPQPTAVDRAFQSISKYSRFVELYYYRIGYPRLVRDRLEQIRTFYEDPAVLQRHVATTERLRDVARDNYGANLLVLLLPYLHGEELLKDAEFYARFSQELTSRGLHVVNMQPIYAQHGARKLVVHRFDPHTNAFANQLASDAVVSYLDAHPELLTSPPPAAQP